MRHGTIGTGLSGMVGLAIVAGVAGPAAGQEGAPGGKADFASVSPMCPVMDEPINVCWSTPTEGGPVYFCCKGCIEKYTADPAKYAAKVQKQREALAKLDKVQVRCPVSGEPVDRKVSIEHGGRQVFFCCPDCIGKYEKEPAKYAAALANSYSYQTKCPVMGGKINPKSFTVLPTGETIYYCCDGCDAKLKADPAKYNANLLAQGIKIDWDKVKAGQGG